MNVAFQREAEKKSVSFPASPSPNQNLLVLAPCHAWQIKILWCQFPPIPATGAERAAESTIVSYMLEVGSEEG